MRSLLLYVLFAISFFFTACGQKNSDNAGRLVTDGKYTYPGKTKGWVSDFEGVLHESQIRLLDSLIAVNEKSTGNEIAIAIIDFGKAGVKDSKDLAAFSIQLFRSWGIGKKDEGNGVGILFSERSRMIRIEVGTGLETKLTDPEAKIIIDSIMIPEFKQQNSFLGLKKGLEAIIAEIK